MTAAAYTSARAVTAAPSTCSGAMYESLPLSCPARVVCRFPTAAAPPKSSTVEHDRCEVPLAGKIRMESLDRAGPRALGLASPMSQIHRRHAAGSDLTEERVAADGPLVTHRVPLRYDERVELVEGHSLRL